jgi:hypothetical protein
LSRAGSARLVKSQPNGGHQGGIAEARTCSTFRTESHGICPARARESIGVQREIVLVSVVARRLGRTTQAETITKLCTKIERNGKGKPTLTEYINDDGEKVKVKLKSEFVTGFAESAEKVEEICPEAVEKRMLATLKQMI